MMGLQRYGIQRKVNFNIQFNVIQIIQDLVEMEIILLQEDLIKLFKFGKLVFMIA
jgi:hypothetical protein